MFKFQGDAQDMRDKLYDAATNGDTQLVEQLLGLDPSIVDAADEVRATHPRNCGAAQVLMTSFVSRVCSTAPRH